MSTAVLFAGLQSDLSADRQVEYLWRNTKQRATHNKYFEQFGQVIQSVEEALGYFAAHPEEVLGLFGRYCDEVGLECRLAA